MALVSSDHLECIDVNRGRHEYGAHLPHIVGAHCLHQCRVSLTHFLLLHLCTCHTTSLEHRISKINKCIAFDMIYRMLF